MVETRGSAATERIPVLALPDFVLLPDTLIPLRLPERRYGALVEECLSDRRLIVISGATGCPAGSPPPIAGLGRILSDRRETSGRYDLFVHGLEPIAIVGQSGTPSCPFALVERLPDEECDPATLSLAQQRLLRLASALATGCGGYEETLSKAIVSTEDPGALATRIGALVLETSAQRQQLLEARSPQARCEFVVNHLARRLVVAQDVPFAAGDWVN